MEGIGRAVSVLLWFVSLTAAMFWFIPFAVLLTVVIAAAWFCYRRGDYVERGSAWLVLSLPTVWIFIGLWGGWWWRYWERQAPPNPEWVQYPVTAALLVEIALAVVLVWWLRGVRPVVAAFALLNVYFTLWIVFLAGMTISGTWL
jgi:hypothetical protein